MMGLLSGEDRAEIARMYETGMRSSEIAALYRDKKITQTDVVAVARKAGITIKTASNHQRRVDPLPDFGRAP